MEIALNILQYTLPALFVLIAIYFTQKQLLKGEAERRRTELLRVYSSSLTPVRLQAYERLTLFLERIVPDQLVTRIPCNQLNANQLHTSLLETIRKENEHNLSQQLYVGNDVWIMVQHAKESMVQLVNTCAAQLTPQDSGIQLASLILDTYHAVDETPVQIAIDLLKKEMNERFG
ncbi:hypothetical protein [Microbacter margulisiae]|uniref:Uncharacterized protein n=1 Tax=Microbacter margulisiae TaxID=1350067 RepID=A0A7W5H0M6_9PORP|nr:hypothetical protein [Microbacter margulisiae]MBB3186723.1 hypothetical protein [Microbacter margulisiae]